MKDNKLEQDTPILLSELMKLLAACEPSINQQRVFKRILALVMAEVFAFGRRTITQLLLTLGLKDEDWSAWYRLFSEERFDEEALSKVMLECCCHCCLSSMDCLGLCAQDVVGLSCLGRCTC